MMIPWHVLRMLLMMQALPQLLHASPTVGLNAALARLQQTA